MNARRFLFGLLILVLAIQLIPADRENPPSVETIAAPPGVEQILRRSCFDCHSYETQWPWYAYIAPASWLVAYDVHEARDHLNFSTWQLYDEDERIDNLEEMWEEVEEGNMPLWYYLPLHPEANLDDRERRLLHEWVLESTTD